MEKRQRYCVKERLPRNLVASSSSYCGRNSTGRGGREPQCSYMFGGLGDLRRQPYLLRSPLRENAAGNKTIAYSHQTAPVASAKRHSQKTRYCDAATAAAKFRRSTAAAEPPSRAVKVNPLFLSTSPASGRESASLSEQMVEKLRRTKDREMMTAITEVASHGKRPPLSKPKKIQCFPLSAKTTSKRWPLRAKRKRRKSGPFILRPRPPVKNELN